MDAVQSIERLHRMGTGMGARTKDVSHAAKQTFALLEASRASFLIAGGLAVVHHGYPRFTDDIDVLIDAEGAMRAEQQAPQFGFEVVGDARLRHRRTDVRVDFLVAGRPMPRHQAAYPSPSTSHASTEDKRYLGFAPLIELKLLAGRRQDEADIMALLKQRDDGQYTELEAAIDPSLRRRLLELRRDALEELAYER
ncbi:MAG: hypothetical protein AAGA56_22405 [Myxococcota bacterium]